MHCLKKKNAGPYAKAGEFALQRMPQYQSAVARKLGSSKVKRDRGPHKKKKTCVLKKNGVRGGDTFWVTRREKRSTWPMRRKEGDTRVVMAHFSSIITSGSLFCPIAFSCSTSMRLQIFSRVSPILGSCMRVLRWHTTVVAHQTIAGISSAVLCFGRFATKIAGSSFVLLCFSSFAFLLPLFGRESGEARVVFIDVFSVVASTVPRPTCCLTLADHERKGARS